MTPDRKLYSLLRRDAEATYSPTSASLYREADEAARDQVSHAGKCEIIRELSRRFSEPIMMLDLGCGTGRYFHCAQNVKMLVGVDPSENMLVQARTPVTGVNPHVRLIRSSLHEVAFPGETFDLVICVGVLGLWCPLDALVLRRVADMLRPDGVFFFSAIEYDPVPSTWRRRMATAMRPLLVGAPRRYVERRLRHFTTDAETVDAMGRTYFEQVRVTKWQSPTSRVDLHCVMARPRRVSARNY
jgi:ubiquinone/menaquinone biosynthesis C-methylase UbiE